MGHRHTKEEILDGALTTAHEVGLSQLTFAKVAETMGISDRIVVYYFPSKDDLISEVLVALGIQLQATLVPAFNQRAKDHRELLRKAWPVLARPKSDPIFALFFEASGLAAAGREPYVTLVPQLMEAWITWATSILDGNDNQCRTEAEGAIAVLDGLLLMRNLMGPTTATRAAKLLGLM